MRPFTIELLAISRAFGLVERETICCGTVTVPQCMLLQNLVAGPSEATRLAGLLGSSPSTATRLVDGAVRRGWVERKRDERDRRKVWVELTDSGREEATRLIELTERAVQNVMSFIPVEKRDGVLDALRIVRAAIEASRASGGGCGCG